MYFSSSFLQFGLLALLATNVFATDYFRGDKRKPDDIKKAGGFKAKGFTNPEGTVFQHVEGTLKHPSRDPFIATSLDINFSKKHTPKGWVYTIDSTKITEKVHDVAQEYKDANKKYGHSDEQEMAVEHLIPWDAITKIEKKKGDNWETVDPPKKRAAAPQADDGDDNEDAEDDDGSDE